MGAVVLIGCSGDGMTTPGDDGGTQGDGSIPGTDGNMPPTDSAMQQDTGPVTCNGKTCGPNEVCFNNLACVCKDGFVPAANGCDPAPAGSPSSHTQADVCQKWKDGHVVTDANPFTKGSTNCDLGTLSAGGMADTLKRINMFRWMEGEADVTSDATKNQGTQACAVIQAWNNPGSFSNPHNPPANAVCYTSTGASWCGQSNLAWGTSSPDSIDLYIRDPGQGNATSLGHRRWVLHPPLGKVGVGYYSGGNNGFGGRAQALGVFDTTGSGPAPSWYAWPPAGYVPVQVTQTSSQGWAWSFHLKQKNIANGATMTVKNLVTNANLTMNKMALNQGYGDDAVSFYPSGWTPAAGEIYRVTVTAGATFVYDVRPVTCN
jgi:hypothetical protein